jgi:peptide-methionine (S)-S-oxide reductase
MANEQITLGGGCFWCTEAVFERVEGVSAVISGYANGHVPNPTYAQICEGDTGHVEVVRVEFDPASITLRELLEIFFATHDPTTLNRQGNDVGTQYRSGIYLHAPEQKAVAEAVLAEAQKGHGGRVVTELLPLDSWWPAEEYHQHYFARNPGQGYCAFVVAPKVEKFKRTFKARVKA